MTDPYKKWVGNAVTKVASELNLLDWGIEVFFDDMPPDNDEDTIAWTGIDDRYLNCWIHFAPKARDYWNNGELDKLAHTVTHEIVHILLKPIQKFGYDAVSDQTRPHLVDAVEQATQRISRILLNNFPKKFFVL